MESAPQTFRMWHNSLSRLLKRPADSSDFVWVGRFRLLSIYTILKGFLLLTAGGPGTRLSAFQSGSTLNRTPLLWIGMILGMTISTLLLISGLVVASKDRPCSIGLVMLGASDMCVLLAIVYASILNNLFLLLTILVFTSCTSPLLIERISRYAKRFLQSNSEDGELHLNAAEVARLEATLSRAVAEARKVMNNVHSSAPVLDKQQRSSIHPFEGDRLVKRSGLPPVNQQGQLQDERILDLTTWRCGRRAHVPGQSTFGVYRAFHLAPSAIAPLPAREGRQDEFA